MCQHSFKKYYFFFKFYLFESRKRQECWLTPQLPTMAREGKSPNQEPETQFCPPCGWQGPITWALITASKGLHQKKAGVRSHTGELKPGSTRRNRDIWTCILTVLEAFPK